jgi:hypothetical protein
VEPHRAVELFMAVARPGAAALTVAGTAAAEAGVQERLAAVPSAEAPATAARCSPETPLLAEGAAGSRLPPRKLLVMPVYHRRITRKMASPEWRKP